MHCLTTISALKIKSATTLLFAVQLPTSEQHSLQSHKNDERLVLEG